MVSQPRKRPKQARSLATVEAILQATAQVLVDEGFGSASTNKIAKVAGVSIGSLYQYFPSKEALVAALIEKHINEMMVLIQDAIARQGEHTLPCTIRSLITGMIEAHRHDPALHKAIVEQVPRVGHLDRIMDIQSRMVDMISLAMAARRSELRPKNLHLAAFILVHAVESVTHAAVLKNHLNDDELTDEICDLILRYLLAED